MKRFNVAGVCVLQKHYMVDIRDKLHSIARYVDDDKYFVINRPGKYGKTTTVSLLGKFLRDRYIVIEINFDGLEERSLHSERFFCRAFINLVESRLEYGNADRKIINAWGSDVDLADGFEYLSKKISVLVALAQKGVILMIDGIDKHINNPIFYNFLKMIKHKYVNRNSPYEETFKSVVFVSVHDLKNFKFTLNYNGEKRYNSPFDVAAEFEVDMSFDSNEVSTMLRDYEKYHGTDMDVQAMSDRICHIAGGHPFMISHICKVIDEKLDRDWTPGGLDKAIKIIEGGTDTFFDDLKEK